MWVFAPSVYSPLSSVLEEQGARGEEAVRLFSRYRGPLQYYLIQLHLQWICMLLGATLEGYSSS